MDTQLKTELVMNLNHKGFRLNIFRRGTAHWIEGQRIGTGGGVSFHLGDGDYSKIELIALVRSKLN